jgi:hypothetical protein
MNLMHERHSFHIGSVLASGIHGARCEGLLDIQAAFSELHVSTYRNTPHKLEAIHSMI